MVLVGVTVTALLLLSMLTAYKGFKRRYLLQPANDLIMPMFFTLSSYRFGFYQHQ